MTSLKHSLYFSPPSKKLQFMRIKKNYECADSLVQVFSVQNFL